MAATVGGYEILQRLAVGGMAEVFLARRPGPDGFTKRVAVKRILPHLAKQPDFVSMFLHEAKLAATLDHPHIVHIHDFGSDEGDAYYLAMEYVNGEDLASLFRRAGGLGGPIAPGDVATILIAACEALHHAHEQGVVHRDVTPANLLVSYDGIVKLADFGIAKSQAVASHSKTNTGTLKGKIPYMSPEQARARSVDRRSDLFSLGVVAWELLTGRRLFHRRNELDMLRAVQMCDVPPLLAVRPDLPPGLAAAVETALEPTVDDRWETAAEFELALRAWLNAAGETASKSRLAKTMTRLFGRDAAERRLRAETASTESTAMNTPLPAPLPPGPDSSPHDFGEAAAIAFRPDGTPEPRRSPLHPERWIPQIAMHLHLPPPRMPPLRMVGPLFALLLSAGGLVFGFHAQRHATRALDASMLAPIAAAPVAAAPVAAAPAPRLPALKLVPHDLHLDKPPVGLAVPTAMAPPPSVAPVPAQKRPTHVPRHDRQRRKHPAGV